MSKNPIQNNELSCFMGQIYNKWFAKWRDKEMTDQKWRECLAELNQIVERYDNQATIKTIAYALLDEIQARQKRKYRIALKRI